MVFSFSAALSASHDVIVHAPPTPVGGESPVPQKPHAIYDQRPGELRLG